MTKPEPQLPENNQSLSGSLNNQTSNNDEAEAQRLALQAKKRRTLINWLRVVALLFALFFILSQCGMSKPKAKAAIIESCIKNVPFAEQWQTGLEQLNLANQDKLVQQYCVCMWDEPLQKLTTKQIQSFANISTDEQLTLLGGANAFKQRDEQCMAKLK